jgi:hypothetical protein
MTHVAADDPRRQTLQRILDTFAGSAPPTELERYMHPSVVVHLDRWKHRGTRGWTLWTRHSLATWEFTAVRFEVVDCTADNDVLTTTIRAHVERNGGEEVSEPVPIKYRFEDARVAEIWTSRKNYVFLYGRAFGTLPGFLLHMVRIGLWARKAEL